MRYSFIAAQRLAIEGLLSHMPLWDQYHRTECTAVCKKVCVSDHSTLVCLYLVVLYISGPRPTKTYGTTIRRRHLWVNPYRNQRFAFPLGVGFVSGSWNI